MRNYRSLTNIINASRGMICSVTFRKKDGSTRVMAVQPAALAGRLKGDAACDSAKKATATRRKNHPNLMPVYDIASRSIKSVNLDTVSHIRTGNMSISVD